MEICKTDAKHIIQFLTIAASLADEEVRRRKLTRKGSLRLENYKRLTQIMTAKLSSKLNK